MGAVYRFSLEQSQTRGDRLEGRLESTLAELRARPALQTQASSEEGPSQVSEEGGEGSTTSNTSAAGPGLAEGGGGASTADDKSDEVITCNDSEDVVRSGFWSS